MLIVLANRSVASYPLGGGVWSWMMQYPLGLRALGHNIFWLELIKSSGDRARDGDLAANFLARIKRYGLAQDAAVLVFDDIEVQDLNLAEVYGRPALTIFDLVRSADLLWNMASAIHPPFLNRFRRKALINVDPGHLQILATQYEFGLKEHTSFSRSDRTFRMPDAKCRSSTWRGELSYHLYTCRCGRPRPVPAPTRPSLRSRNGRGRSFPIRAAPSAPPSAPHTCVTWICRSGQGVRSRLATNIGDTDPIHDRETLEAGGWRVVKPHDVAPTPEAYRDYIRTSRAEILCPKPIFREMNTGWFSDRSVCYMALGRPVLAEDSGFGDFVPTGQGVLEFRDTDEAVAGVAEIDGNYAMHSRHAREIAADLFNSGRQLSAMLAAC